MKPKLLIPLCCIASVFASGQAANDDLILYRKTTGGQIAEVIAHDAGKLLDANAGKVTVSTGLSLSGGVLTNTVSATTSASDLTSGTLPTARLPVTVVQTTDTGTITNAMLAGSIAPSKVTGTAAILGVNSFTGNQSISSGAVLFPGSTTIGVTSSGVGNWAGTLALFGNGGSLFATVSSAGINASSATYYGWGNDTFLYRGSSAGKVEQRNSTTAQIYYPHNTWTSTASYERGKFGWESNYLCIGTEKGSAGGTARGIKIQVDGVTKLTIESNGDIIFSGLPTSASGKAANTLYSDGGTLKLAP